MTFLTVYFDIINPEGEKSAINHLLSTLTERKEEVTLTLRSSEEDEGGDDFSLEVSEICLELDDTGVFRLEGKTRLGRVAGYLTVTNSVGEVGRITVATT